MIKTIVKRDGKEEDFSAEKVNGWGEWASKTLHNKVDWGEVVLHAVSTLPETCTSEELQQSLIKFCLNKKTWEYNLMAGRLYYGLIVRTIYGKKPPTVKALHREMVEYGVLVDMGYTDEEYDEIEKIINHKLDLKTTHYEIHQIRNKYALRDKVRGKEFETPQFVFMRMAMALSQHESNRLEHVRKFYDHFSHKRINVPTPYYTNLGTKLNGYASCCLYSTYDSAPSLAAGDHIAYMMTVMSAGIGSHIKTRSLGDPVRNGLIVHQGKIPYYRALVGAISANLQNGRGGAATVYYTAFDPEVEVIAKLKNPMTPASKQVRGCDYSFGSNKFFAKKAALDDEIALFSYEDAPELYEAQYGSSEDFEKLYNEFLASNKPRKMVSARKVLINALNEAYETGRHYLHFYDEMNTHTPFKDKIYSSNLCLTGDTVVTVKFLRKDNEVNITLRELNEFISVGEKIRIKSFNDRIGRIEFRTVTASAMTGKNSELVKITGKKSEKMIRCTPDHKVYTKNRGYVEAKKLEETDSILIHHGEYDTPIITQLEEREDVYDITVNDNHNFFANGILVHNCAEIALPTKGFSSVKELYEPYKEGSGEIGLCNIGGVVVSNIDSDEQYAEVAYYVLKMIDYGIHYSDYVFQNLSDTAKSRLSAGVGILGLAHLMAKKNKKYSSQEGKDFIHELCETHYWHLLNASLRLGKEKGNAPWMNKTKWVDGWLPIDTYNKKVDELVTVKNKRDWDTLRQQIIENGGIRNSVLSAMMPGESCLEKTTKIKKADGELISLEEIFKLTGADIEQEMLELDRSFGGGKWFDLPEPVMVQTLDGAKPCTSVWLNGNTNYIEIEMDDGYVIKATHHHKFLVKNLNGDVGWKMAIELNRGDSIVTTNTQTANVKKISVTEDNCVTMDINVDEVHHYILENGVVSHNSSISSGTTNGPYPIRDFDLVKTNETMVINYVAPESSTLKDKYEIAWNVPSEDLIDCYAIMQKWTDQAISCDLYRRVQGDEKVGSSEMIKLYLRMAKYGVKTRYYINSLTAKGIDLNGSAECESCAL